MSWTLQWEWAGRSGSVQVAPQWSQHAALYGRPGDQIREATIETPLPGVDPVALAQIEPAYLAIGRLYRGADLVIAGRWTGASYDDEGVRFVLGQDAREDAALIPAVGTQYDLDLNRYNLLVEGAMLTMVGATSFKAQRISRIQKQLFADASRKAVGRVGPMVIGAPGVTSDGTRPGSPAYIIDEASPDKRLLIARHRVGAASVTVWGPGFLESLDAGAATYIPVRYTVSHGSDADGDYAYVDIPAQVATPPPGVHAPAVDVEWFVAWDDGDALPGGAGSALLRLYAASSLLVDVDAWQLAVPVLDQWRVAGYIDEAVPPSELAQRQILPLLPVSVVQTARGLAPFIWPWLSGDRPEAHLIAGAAAARAGPVSYIGTPTPRSDWSYGYDPQTRDTTSALTVGGSDAYTIAARSPIGKADEVQAAWVWADSVAQSLAHIRAAFAAQPPRAIPYMCDPGRYGLGGSYELRIGAPILLTDEAMGFDAVEAAVGEIEQDADALRVVVYLRDDVLRA